MSTPELTPWFPADVKPIRRGVYQVEQGIVRWYSYFDGSGFGWQDLTPSEAFRNRHQMTGCAKSQTWRGLAQDPKVKK